MLQVFSHSNLVPRRATFSCQFKNSIKYLITIYFTYYQVVVSVSNGHLMSNIYQLVSVYHNTSYKHKRWNLPFCLLPLIRFSKRVPSQHYINEQISFKKKYTIRGDFMYSSLLCPHTHRLICPGWCFWMILDACPPGFSRALPKKTPKSGLPGWGHLNHGITRR